jgi:plasmid stabilization system protein ParE
MKLRFTLRATQDLIDIANYIRERNPAGSLRVRAAILESLQNLVLFPEAGRRQAVEGVRKFVTRKYPTSSITRSIRPPRRSSFSPSGIRPASGSTRMPSRGGRGERGGHDWRARGARRTAVFVAPPSLARLCAIA